MDKCPKTPEGKEVNLHNGCRLPLWSKFHPDLTTDFTKVNDLLEVDTFEAGIYGMGIVSFPGKKIALLRYYDAIDRYEPLDLNDAIFMALNKIEILTSDDKYPVFDKSATLTLFDLHTLEPPLTDPQVLRDGKVCVGCKILSYVDGTLKFTVPGFSSYSAGETPSGGAPSSSGGSSSGGGGSGSRASGYSVIQTINLDIKDKYTIDLSRAGKLFITYNGEQYSMKITQINRNSATLSFVVLGYFITLYVSGERAIDLDKDNTPDVLVTLDEISSRNIATLTFVRRSAADTKKPFVPPTTDSGPPQIGTGPDEQIKEIFDEGEEISQKLSLGFRWKVIIVLFLLTLGLIIQYIYLRIKAE